MRSCNENYSEDSEDTGSLTNRVSNLLGRRYEQLLLNEKYVDCAFIVSGHVVKCHKLILASASPVFDAMLYGPLNHINKPIEIDDMNENGFRRLMLYIYKGEIDFQEFTLEETLELYYGAEKYLMESFINDCLLAIQMKLRFWNILPSLELSVCLDSKDLLNTCLTFFKRCCLGQMQDQFLLNLKAHYYHIAQVCFKVLAQYMEQNYDNIEQQYNLLQLFSTWHTVEMEHNLVEDVCMAVSIDADLMQAIQNIEDNCNNGKISSEMSLQNYVVCVERFQFKACSPFVINLNTYQFSTFVKCDHFIALRGLMLNSRLQPKAQCNLRAINTSNSGDYMENICITITASHTEDDDVQDLNWTWNVEQAAKYNDNVIVRWPVDVVLSVDTEYQIKLAWSPSTCNGAEYPCVIMSDQLQGINFRDQNFMSGSLLKGLFYTHLN